MQTNQQKHSHVLQEIISYTYPKLYVGKRWYIGFYAFDPAIGNLRRKTIKLNYIEKTAERKRYANELVKRLSYQLDRGWNPWIEVENVSAYKTFAEVIAKYHVYLDKMYSDGNYREETYRGYVSYTKIMVEFNKLRPTPITYIYQFNREFCSDFLDYVYVDRNNTSQTRDNHLAAMRIFSGWLVQKAILKEKPTEGIKILGKRSYRKERTILAEHDVIRLRDLLTSTNKHYLLACYILHYCLIRPKEMSKLRLSNISFKNKTIYIPGEVSKNKKGGTVTLPDRVTKLMIELNIHANPVDYYLFSNHFMPGETYKSEKCFRDYWLRHVVRELHFPKNYKFYSLKDTGITSMLRKYDRLTVRDQARHSSILMTDIYTPHDIQEANHLIASHEGIL